MTTADDEPEVPLESEALAVRRWSPSGIDTAREKVPEEVAVVVPRESESTRMSTVEPALAVPETVTELVDNQL
jgi:hypothetical protein